MPSCSILSIYTLLQQQMPQQYPGMLPYPATFPPSPAASMSPFLTAPNQQQNYNQYSAYAAAAAAAAAAQWRNSMGAMPSAAASSSGFYPFQQR